MASECADSKIDEAVHLHGLHLVLSWRKESSVGFLMGSLRMQEEAKFVSQCVSALGCGSHYEFGIEDLCLAKFRLDMHELGERHWCSWEDTVELYGRLTNCTNLVAFKLGCFWPNKLVDDFFIRVHKHYFQDCSLSGRLLKDPPNRILGPFIVVPILVTLLMTGLVVWRSKRSEGIV
nr:receptor activity-modifying protein 1 isoform X1 [Gasterosteus aculeatus aculeatus]